MYVGPTVFEVRNLEKFRVPDFKKSELKTQDFLFFGDFKRPKQLLRLLVIRLFDTSRSEYPTHQEICR